MPHFWLAAPSPPTHSPPSPNPPATPAATAAADSLTRVSTLDVVAGPPGRTPPLVLLVYAAAGGSAPWVQAAAAVRLGAGEGGSSAQQQQQQQEQGGCGPGWPVRVVHVLPCAEVRGGDCAAAASRSSSTAAAAAAATAGGAHSTDVLVDVHGTWPSTMQLPPGSAVLVRPDGHIAWRWVAAGAGGGKPRDAAGHAPDAAAARLALEAALRHVLGSQRG